jgi:hypothetical protein
LANAMFGRLSKLKVVRQMGDDRQSRKGEILEIRVRGILDEKWSDWFDGLAIIPQTNGETLMTGPVIDQAALHGLLNKIRDIGLPLLSVNRMAVGENQ